MDVLDLKIIDALLLNGRATWTELGLQLQLSIPTIAERVKKLEEQGVLQGYRVIVDYGALGFALTALVFVTLAHPKHRAEFIQKINSSAEVLECLHVTGDDDYMLKVVCRDSKHLDMFLNEHLKSIVGVAKTRTIIALSAPKERALGISEVMREG